MANHAPPDPATKNPGGLAGHTGVKEGSASRAEQGKPYSITVVLS